MGTVYEAQQDSPRRVVALKVIRAGILSPDLLRRFMQESQVLGRLQHPGIAQVYEAGTFADEGGRDLPFFAMEFIRGVPLTQFATRNARGTRDRLELVAKVCDAVAHAHQKGVIHRDLKPANILVDESGQPKILDFGVARATDSDIQQTTIQTDVGQLIGTVPYMSPEQVSGDPSELDTRSDVYALGVILYELLAGRPPYDLRKKMIHEAARIIREEEPSRLSSISRGLRGDVETIVAKALEKDKSRRYQSAEALAADIRRYVRDEPISARPASTWYQVRKFSRRHRALVAGVGAVFVVLMAGLAGTMWQAAEARSESRRADERAKAAEEERSKAEKVVEFVQNALLSSDPYSSGTQGITVAEAMLQAAKGLEAGDLADQPMVEAQLRFTIADIMTGNGRPDEAIEVARRGLEITRSLHTGDVTDVARAIYWFATYLDNRDRSAEALPLFEESYAMHVRLNGPTNDEVAGSLAGIASCLQTLGRPEEALAKYEATLAIYERLGQAESAPALSTLQNMGVCLERLARPEEALAMFQQSLALRRRLEQGDSPALAMAISSVAYSLDSLGRREEALAMYREALAMEQRLFQGDHPLIASSLGNIGYVLNSMGCPHEGHAIYLDCLAMYRRLYEGDHPRTARMMANLAMSHDTLGNAAQAIELQHAALAMRERLFHEDHPDIAVSLFNLAGHYRDAGWIDDAIPFAREAAEMARRVFDKAHPMRNECEMRLANLEAAAH